MEQISIKELKTGNKAAFKQLVESHKNKVVNTCFGFIHNKADAEDIAQEVFIEVYQSIKNFNEDSSISTWIYRIAVNKSLDFIRKTKRKKRWSGLTRINLEHKDESDNWFADEETPHILLENKERIKILNTAIDALPENQKSAFTLHKYDDLSYKEIAEIMQTSISSVESLMHRAKKNLQNKLAKHYISSSKK